MIKSIYSKTDEIAGRTNGWRIHLYYALHWTKRYRRILSVSDYLHLLTLLPTSSRRCGRSSYIYVYWLVQLDFPDVFRGLRVSSVQLFTDHGVFSNHFWEARDEIVGYRYLKWLSAEEFLFLLHHLRQDPVIIGSFRAQSMNHRPKIYTYPTRNISDAPAMVRASGLKNWSQWKATTIITTLRGQRYTTLDTQTTSVASTNLRASSDRGVISHWYGSGWLVAISKALRRDQEVDHTSPHLLHIQLRLEFLRLQHPSLLRIWK